MKLKPLNAPEPGTRVWVKGHKVEERGEGGGDGVVEWGVEFPSGFHDVFKVDLERFSKEDWGRLWKVEVVADFGVGGLDWEFCLDDLRVGFTERERGEREGGEQKLLVGG